MLRLAAKVGINAFVLWLTAWLLPGIDIESGVVPLIVVALVFGLVNTFIKPIARLLTLPLRAMTLGLFTVVVNGVMVLVTAWITDALVLDGGALGQILNAIAAALVISIVSSVLNVVLPESLEV